MNPKIIATLGPSSFDYEVLKKLVAGGVDIVRVNFSHGTKEQWQSIRANLAKIAKETGIKVKMMADLQGPRIRLGILPSDVTIIKGQTYTLITGQADVGKNELPVDYPQLYQFIKKGDPLYLFNRMVELETVKVEGKKIFAKAITGGVIASRKGINVPKTVIERPLEKKDVEFARFVSKNGADYISLSFVQSQKDVDRLRKVINNKNVDIIAKIERATALDDIDNIIRVSDGIMIARGDLGIEMPIEELCIIQKNLIRHAHQHEKPAIVATQMLDSMTKSPYPTRAEASDVANAIFDGADAVMLSDETASGQYPVETVSMMNRIVNRVNEYFNSTNYFEHAHKDKPSVKLI